MLVGFKLGMSENEFGGLWLRETKELERTVESVVGVLWKGERERRGKSMRRCRRGLV
jgi:hypothetical protein